MFAASSPSRRLRRIEINLLKHLLRCGGAGFPITVPRNAALVPLWRLSLIEIWYRQDRDASGGRRTQFVSLTVDGRRRIEAILSANTRRLADSQGRSDVDDQSPEPKQE